MRIHGLVAALSLIALGSLLVAAPVAAQVTRRNIATLPFESGLIVIDAHSDGNVVVGVSRGDSVIAIPLRAPSVKEWADSTTRLLAYRPRASRQQRSYRSSVESSQAGAGISFTRYVTGANSSYRLFFADTSYGGFPFAVSKDEAQVLVANLRRAVAAARPAAKPPAKSPARTPAKPAAKPTQRPSTPGRDKPR